MIVVAERGSGNPFHTIYSMEYEVIGKDFIGPAIQIDLSPASNYRTLLGTPDGWYWEHATDCWRAGGKVIHDRSELSARFFFGSERCQSISHSTEFVKTARESRTG